MGKTSCAGRKDTRKKLSWIYRQKTKLEKNKNLESNATNDKNADNTNARIIARNLPFNVTEEDVRKFYEPFGKIKEINLPRRQDGKLIGCSFIQFERMEDASKAIFNTNKKEFYGRVIVSAWAIPKSKFCEKLEKAITLTQESDTNEKQLSQNIQTKDNSNNDTFKKEKNEKDYERKQKRKTLQKMKKQKKRARIIIRNLAFQVTEDNLREYFSKYGEIDEIKLLTKVNGQIAGCAFLQFQRVQSAAKALHYANMQSLLNRPMVVDWAVPKNKFLKNSTDETEIKPEIKTEIIEEDNAQDISIKTFRNEDELENSDTDSNCKEIIVEDIKADEEFDQNKIIKNEVESINSENNDYSDSYSDNDDNMTNQSDKEEEKDDEKEVSFDLKCPRKISNDISEGRTVFLKNLPFSVKNNELKKCMEQFGPVYYALICIDELTEHSKGTAFVKFKDASDAEKCLSAGNKLLLRDQIVEVHRALHRNEIENKKSLKQQKIKDSRNLYLVKEGVVLAGSPAAAEVSVTDMEKRLKLEQWKSQILRNLNMFVSRVRLVIYNLPDSFDDVKLRQLFKNHSGPKAIINEARIMRNMKNIDTTGKGKSKEFGFVTFTNHEDALRALRSINNNPTIFSKNRRPIVGFSIENRIMVNAKERRIQKSREHNPLWSGDKNKRKYENIKKEIPHKKIKIKKSDDTNVESYTGISSKLGQDKLRSNFNLKSQAVLHAQTMKKQKRLNKAIKEKEIRKKERIQKQKEHISMKQTRKLNTDDVNFEKLVNNYRNKLKNINLKKSKWYENSSRS